MSVSKASGRGPQQPITCPSHVPGSTSCSLIGHTPWELAADWMSAVTGERESGRSAGCVTQHVTAPLSSSRNFTYGTLMYVYIKTRCWRHRINLLHTVFMARDLNSHKQQEREVIDSTLLCQLWSVDFIMLHCSVSVCSEEGVKVVGYSIKIRVVLSYCVTC